MVKTPQKPRGASRLLEKGKDTFVNKFRQVQQVRSGVVLCVLWLTIKEFKQDEMFTESQWSATDLPVII